MMQSAMGDDSAIEPEKMNLTTDTVCVVVLNSKSMEARWVEVPALVRWYQKVKQLAMRNLGLLSSKPQPRRDQE